MMTDVKDSVANGVTITATGAAIVQWDAVLTMVLIATGIVLNIVRIVETRRAGKKKQD